MSKKPTPKIEWVFWWLHQQFDLAMTGNCKEGEE